MTAFNIGNGDLSKAFAIDGSSSTTSYLDQLYAAANNLTAIQNQIKSNNNSEAVTALTANYNNIISDIALSTNSTYGKSDVSYVMGEWRGWTDASQIKYQKCATSTNDYWVQSQSKCPSGYSVGTAGSSSTGAPTCLLYPDWSSSQVQTRYGSIPSGCSSVNSDFSSVSSAASAYYNSITTYTGRNKDTLNLMIDTNNYINSNFVSMSAKLSSSISNISGILNPLVNIFQSIVGNNGIFTLINCCKNSQFNFSLHAS